MKSLCFAIIFLISSASLAVNLCQEVTDLVSKTSMFDVTLASGETAGTLSLTNAAVVDDAVTYDFVINLSKGATVPEHSPRAYIVPATSEQGDYCLLGVYATDNEFSYASKVTVENGELKIELSPEEEAGAEAVIPYPSTLRAAAF